MHIGRGRRRKRRRTQWPFFRFLINTMPPPTAPPGGTGGAVPTDIAMLIAELGGDADVPAFYDARINVVTVGGVVSSWLDARGPGFGPTLVATGHPTLTGAGPAASVNTDGATSWLQTSDVALFDLSLPYTLVLGCTLPDVSTIYAGVGPVTNTPCLQVWPDNGNVRAHYQPANLFPVYGTAPGPSDPGCRTLDGRRYGLLFGENGTAVTLGCWPAPNTTTTLSAGPGAGHARLSLGTDPGATTPTAMQFAFAFWLARVFTVSDAALIGAWGVAYHACFNSQSNILVHDGDSLTIGFDLTDLTANYPTVVSTTAPFAASWANVNVASSGQTMAGMVTDAPALVDVLYDPTRATNIVAAWGGSNDIAIDSATAAATFASLATYVNARLAVGWSVVIITCVDRNGINETIRATYNLLITSTYGTGAVQGVAVADAAGNANIGANGANPNLTYFMADGTNLTPAGYAIVAGLVEAAALSLAA
jgi:lysophospholipase L1-like esterase